MAGSVLEVTTLQAPDRIGIEVATRWYTWNALRAQTLQEWEECRAYIYATDTTKTTNAKLPWKNKTTIPKLCQIRDNLYSQYMASCFPKTKFVEWRGHDRTSDTKQKKRNIEGFMCYAIAQPEFKSELSKCIMDYIDTGNAFMMPDWRDDRVEVKALNSTAMTQTGYVGPTLRRISPYDIVFNPIAPTFDESPKIVRSIVSLGEVKAFLESLSTADNREAYEELYEYIKNIRTEAKNFAGEIQAKDEFMRVDGFTNYRMYLESNYCELLTFYGDIYDPDTDKLLKNQIITIVDRHKVIDQRPNPSFFGKPPIYHVGWRKRQDNLWAMGPLANLVGLQYRLDHVENLKADCFDLIAFPPLKIKGYVDDFEWGPFARINVGDEGDVEMLTPPFQVLQYNQEIQTLMMLMEELAGSPKEAMGFRTPGEKTKYEVQRIENAGSRIFNNKTGQFEEFFLEPGMNGMLEVSRRKVTSDILARYFDDETRITKFLELTPEDITGAGRIRPYAARHYAEQAEMVQNLTNFFTSPLGQDPGIKAHFSTFKLAKLFEHLFEIDEFEIVLPYVRMAEEAEAQQLANTLKERVLAETLTEANLTQEDVAQAAQEQENQQPFSSGMRGFSANDPGTLPQEGPQPAPTQPVGGAY